MVTRPLASLLTCCAGAVLAFAASADIEDIKNGADLERVCNSAIEQERQDCAAYVTLAMTSTRLMQKSAKHCLFYDAPEELSSDAAVNVLIDWLRDHSDRRDIKAGFVVDSAMRDTFPCKD